MGISHLEYNVPLGLRLKVKLGVHDGGVGTRRLQWPIFNELTETTRSADNSRDTSWLGTNEQLASIFGQWVWKARMDFEKQDVLHTARPRGSWNKSRQRLDRSC
jgi:hypothetical protein